MNDPSPPPPTDQPGKPKTAGKEEGLFSPGCQLGALSVLVFWTIQDAAMVDAHCLRVPGRVWQMYTVMFAPLACVLVWALVFHLPIGKKRSLASLRSVRRRPALARHVILWASLGGVLFLLHCAFG